MSKKSLFLNIQPFNGDPKFVRFFFQQLKSVKELNELGNKQILAIFTNKLEGSALEFYVDTPAVQNLKTLDELEAAFIEFFTSTDIVHSLKALDSLQIKEDEKFKQFASRLDVAVRNVYPNVDGDSLSQIKFMTLLRLAPKYIKAKLLEEGISDFKAAIARADVLKNIHLANLSPPAKKGDNAVVYHNQVSNQHSSFSNDNSSADFVPSNDYSVPQRSFRRPTQKFHKGDAPHQWHKPNNNKNKWHNNNNNFKRRHNTFKRNDNCRFCGKSGHYMKDCYHFINLINRSSESHSSNFNHNRHTKHNDSNRRDLNDRRK